MADIIKTIKCCSVVGEAVLPLKIYFDTGSPRTFLKQSIALKMKGVLKLPKPIVFSGLENGKFYATHILQIHLKLLNMWVPHLCYVVPDKFLDPAYDVLLGHDFMQIYDIKLMPKRKDIIVKKESLKLALKVRRSEWN